MTPCRKPLLRLVLHRTLPSTYLRTYLCMRTTVDIPDALYRRLKSQSAARGLPVRQVLLHLVEQWLASGPAAGTEAHDAGMALSNQEKAARLRAFLDETTELVAHSPPGPSLQQALDAGRDRLEPGP